MENVDFIVFQMENGQSFSVEKVCDYDGEFVLRATLLESGETSRGVAVEYDRSKSFMDNVLDMYEFIGEFLKTPQGKILFGEKFQH